LSLVRVPPAQRRFSRWIGRHRCFSVCVDIRSRLLAVEDDFDSRFWQVDVASFRVSHACGFSARNCSMPMTEPDLRELSASGLVAIGTTRDDDGSKWAVLANEGAVAASERWWSSRAGPRKGHIARRQYWQNMVMAICYIFRRFPATASSRATSTGRPWPDTVPRRCAWRSHGPWHPLRRRTFSREQSTLPRGPDRRRKAESSRRAAPHASSSP
jgi:hypothetical protein